jgi:hypothetical protein
MMPSVMHLDLEDHDFGWNGFKKLSYIIREMDGNYPDLCRCR